MCGKKDGEIVSIDGNRKPIHMVSAWANQRQLVLGELAVEEKSNEITAIPQLMDMLDVAGCIVTADAMSCQKEAVRKIRDGKADYVIGLKGNQPALLEDISLYFEHFSRELPNFVTRVKAHGRIEKRDDRLLTDLS